MGGASDDGGFLATMVKQKVRKVVSGTLGDFSERDIKNAILTDSPLVKNKVPDRHREKLEQNGESYRPMFEKYVHPDTVWGWLHDPDWVPSEDAREDLEGVVETIESTPGGKEWFEDQIYDVWEVAGLEKPDDRRSL